MGSTSSSEATVDAVLDLLSTRSATPGGGRVVSVDGPAGSGKTTLATALASATGAPIVHTDDLLEGWAGLPGLPGTLVGLLRPLAAGQPGRYRRFDWHGGLFAEDVVVPPSPLLLVDGVGSGSLPAADLVTVLVWVEAPYDLRMRRGLERDGDAFAPHWTAWADAEAAHFAEHHTRERADVLVDGTGAGPARVSG